MVAVIARRRGALGFLATVHPAVIVAVRAAIALLMLARPMLAVAGGALPVLGVVLLRRRPALGGGRRGDDEGDGGDEWLHVFLRSPDR